jgi:hypothetical protein
MIKINKGGRIAGAVSALAVTGAVVGISLLGGGAADASQPRAAAAVVAPLPANSVTGPVQIKDGTVYSADLAPGLAASFTTVFNNTVGTPAIKPNAVTEDKLSQAVRDKLAKVGTPGTPGAPGADAILSVTADTMVTARPDTATDGSVWANDDMTRTLTVNRQHAAEASKCGAGAVKCWFYTGTIKDNGTFKTVAGAHAPNSATPISGTVEGTVNGVYEIEFYATSDKPNPSLVDSTVTGAAPTTSNWAKLAFPAGTQFSAVNGVDYTWVYKAPKTCEVHTQTTNSTTGDIRGLNACTQ